MMRELFMRMVLAGLLFGATPILVNRSGLTGTTATLIGFGIAFFVMIPVAMHKGVTISGAHWWFMIAAAFTSIGASLLFNVALVEISPKIVGRISLIVLLMETAVFAAYQMYMNGQLSLRVAAGFAAAAIATVLLVPSS
jgi:hypothetical protein